MPRREMAGKPSPERDRMWRAVRMNRRLKLSELMELCSVSRKCAEKYLAALVAAGYLRGSGTRGCKGQTYTLVRNTGPFAPRCGRGAVFDPNLEIEREREHRRGLLAELEKSEKRLARLGAFVEQRARMEDAG